MAKKIILVSIFLFACAVAISFLMMSRRPTLDTKQKIQGVNDMLDGIVRRFLYYPEKIPQDAQVPYYVHGAREVFIDAQDGNRIHGLYWPAREGRPTILFFHGNAQTVFEWALIREELEPLDCGLLLIDYPGYGKSTGAPREDALYAAGRASLRYLTEREGVAQERVILFGKSLGGGVATEIAKDARVLGVVLESTFTSVPSVAKILLPMIPQNVLFKSEVYDSGSKIPSIASPILVVHGAADDLIPVAEGKKLFDLARSPKKLYLVPGAGHNDVSMTAGPEYGRTLRAWLDEIETGS